VNLEQGLTEFPDRSVDVFVSTSSIEHLTPDAQKTVFAEMQRVLRPGGVFCGTISYITRLTDDTVELLQRDPAFEQSGSSVFGSFDARACLEAAPLLRPAFPPASWARFPGFDGFDEEALLRDDTLIADFVGSYGNVRLLPEIDALRLAWYEMGLFLRKDA
jgi:SAM-dependent methyltransferase